MAGSRRLTLLRRYVAAAAALWLSPASAHAELLAGAARVDITPDTAAWRVPLGGYAARRGAPSIGVHDPIYARALVLGAGTRRAAVVSIDLCFLPASVRAAVARCLPAHGVTDISAQGLFLAATHTHTAPDPLAMHAGNTFKFPGWTAFDPRLLAFTADRIAEAIGKAEARLQPASLRDGVRSAAGLNRNRRDDPITDHGLTVAELTGSGGRPIAAIVNFASHPTLYSAHMMRISADWPGVMCPTVERALGGSCVCLFLNGDEGDAAPAGAVGDTEEARVQDYGVKVARSAISAIGSSAPDSDPLLQIWSEPVTLPPRKADGLFLLAAAQLGIPISHAPALLNALMPTSSMLTFVRLGRLLLMGFPCEPTGALGSEAKAAARRAGCALPAVSALTNDWLAYALTPAQYRAGRYEAGMSFFGPSLGPTLIAAVRQGLAAPMP